MRPTPVLILLLCAAGLPATPQGPVFGRHFVAAGLGEPGYKDGAFAAAQFKAPAAVAVSKDGRHLYVADRGNDAVRRVLLDQRSRVETLAGGPGKDTVPAPSAVALSHDGGTLYVLSGPAGRVLRLPAAGGAVSAVRVAGKPLEATALWAHPDADRLYALDARKRSLTVLSHAGGGHATLALADGPIDLEGVLAGSPSQLFLLSASHGALQRLTLPGVNDVGAQGVDALRDKTVGWDRIALLGAGARGLTADEDRLWIWDQAAAQFRVFHPVQNDWQDYPLRDYEGQWLQRPTAFPRTPFQDDLRPRSLLRPLLKGPLGLAGDGPRGVFYAAEADGNRIVGLLRPAWDARRGDGLPDYQSSEKIPGVTRILLLGDSMSLSYDGEAGEAPSVEGGFGKKLELYLNAFSALKGKGRRFEVLQQSVALGAMGGGLTAYYLNLPDALRKLKADEVVTLLTYMNINLELLGMTRSRCPDDVCGALVDPFFFDQKPAEMMENYGPVHRGFLKWLKEGAPGDIKSRMHLNEPGTQLDPGGTMYATDLLGNDAYRGWVLKVHAKLTAKAAQKAKRDGVRLTQVLLPLRNNLAPGENAVGGMSFSEKTLPAWMDADLERVAAEAGCGLISLSADMRALQPTLFPLVGASTHHYTLRGIEWAALAAALAYVEALP